MTGSVTVKDVAYRAGVSVGTVSRVFNNYSNVTEESRDRVVKAAISLGYKKLTAKALPERHLLALKEIGFLFCSPLYEEKTRSNTLWPYILYEVEREAYKFGIKVIYRDMRDVIQMPPKFLLLIQKLQLDGILLADFVEPAIIPLVESLNIPVVAVVNHLPGYRIDCVDSDYFEGASIAVRYLIKQGHRQIAYIGSPTLLATHPASVDLRYTGYCMALLDAGLSIKHELIEVGDFSIAGGYQACRRLLERYVPFTAIFCMNDTTAIGAVEALRKVGRRIPEDVSVVGFDDIALVAHLTPALTTVRINKEALGAIAVRHLLEQVENPTKIGTSTFVDVELIERNSVSSPCSL